MLRNCCCPLKSKFLLPRLKSASVNVFEKGHLHMKQMSVLDSLPGPVTFRLDFSQILCLVYVCFSWGAGLSLNRKAFCYPQIALPLWYWRPCLAWQIEIVAHRIQIWVWPLITLPPAPVCIAVSGHWMLPPESPSTIFVDRVDGLIWVVLLQKMHLLSESHLRSSLHEFKSLSCVHTDAVCWIWPYYIVDTNKSLLTGGW